MPDSTPATPNKLSPFVQAFIAFALLLMFGGVLFLPAFKETFRADADVKQTLFTLVTAVVFFFIGRNTGSDSRDAALTAAVIASPAVVAEVKAADPSTDSTTSPKGTT